MEVTVSSRGALLRSQQLKVPITITEGCGGGEPGGPVKSETLSERQPSTLRPCRDNCVSPTFPYAMHSGLPEGLSWTERRGHRPAQQVRQHAGGRGSVEGAAATPPRANWP